MASVRSKEAREVVVGSLPTTAACTVELRGFFGLIEHPVGTWCRFCKCVPYRTEEERDRARARLRALAALTTAAGKREYAKARKAHADLHGRQYEFEIPIAKADMDKWVPELLHYGDLNAEKQKPSSNRDCPSWTRTIASGRQLFFPAWARQN